MLNKLVRLLTVHIANHPKNLSYNHEWIYVRKRQEFMQANENVPISSDRNNLYSQISTPINLAVEYLEFGVYEGKSMQFWSENLTHSSTKLHGFDTFEGLPEHWINSKPKGAYSTSGKTPEIQDKRVSFHKGLFQETLPLLIKNRTIDFSKQLIVNLDADLYSATAFVLASLLPYLKKNDIIIFDEFGAFLLHEFKAFCDFQAYSNLHLKLIHRTEKFSNVAFKIE